MKKIKLVSFNMHGFHQGCSVIEDLINNDTPGIMSKVFEHCIIDRYQSFLVSSDNQFGFKK